MDTFLEFILGQDPLTVVLVLMLLSALENVFPHVPADVAGALGAFWAVRSGHLSPVTVGLLCFLANQITSVWVYFWVRSKGPVVLESPTFQSLLPPEIQPMMRRHIERFGSLGIFVSRFLPGLRAGVLPFAAINGLSPLKTLIPAAAASFLWYVGLTIAGSALGLAYEDVRATVARVTGVLGAVGITILIAGGYLVWRAGKRARARRLAEDNAKAGS